MGFFSNLISPEGGRQKEVVNPTIILDEAPKIGVVDAKADMMRKVQQMVESGAANDNSAEAVAKEGGVLTEALRKVNSEGAGKIQESEKEKIVGTEMKVEDLAVETKAKIPAVEIEIPTNFQPPVAVETTKVVESKAELTETELSSGREYVVTFLKILDDYLKAGKELEKLTAEKDKARAKLDGELEEKRTLQKDGVAMKEALEVFMSAQGEDSQKDLEAVLNAFEAYKKSFEAKVTEIEKDGTQAINKILLNINSRKNEVAKLVAAMGNLDNVKNIMDHVRRAEAIARRYNERNEVAGSPERSAIFTFVQNEVESGKMFLEGNDIVGLLMAIFAKKGEGANDNTPIGSGQNKIAA